MPALQFYKLYAISLVTFFAIDVTWLGVVAKQFYNQQLGHLTRADVQWIPAVVFYLIYVAAIVVLCVKPALERTSISHAFALGALFGLAAYAAFDLTALALLKDYPLRGAVVDLLWGTALTATVSAVTFSVGRWIAAS